MNETVLKVIVNKHWFIRLTNEAKRRGLSLSEIASRCIIHQLPIIMAVKPEKKKRPYGLNESAKFTDSENVQIYLDILWKVRLEEECKIWNIPQSYMIRKMIIEKALPEIEKQELRISDQ